MALYLYNSYKTIIMKKIATILLISAFTSVFGQQMRYVKKAERAVGRVEYAKALKFYDKALDENPDLYEANAGKGLLLGELMEQYVKAIPYLEKALDKGKKDTLLTLYYTLGRAYHFIGEYDKALFCYNKLNNFEEIGNPMFQTILNKNISDCNYAIKHRSATSIGKSSVQNVGPIINTYEPEYAAVLINKNELLFTAKKKDNSREKVNQWDGKYFESMYISQLNDNKFSPPRRYTRPDLHKNSKFSKYHESTVSVSPDGNFLFIYKGGDIFIAPVNASEKSPKKLSKKINMSRYQNHATVTKDNKTIYFSSEGKKGYGGTDIYKAVKNSKDEWNEPELLDSTINTEFNEDAPYIHEDGTLYFSSNGHPGFGGYDIYKTNFTNNRWSRPVNLGQPINSSGDDIFLSLVDGDEGYFSSSRMNGYGDLDIYSVNLNPKLPKDSISDPLLALEKLPTPETSKNTNEIAKNEKGKRYLSEEDLKKLGWNSSNLYFGYNEVSLKDNALASLDNNIEILKKNNKLSIVIFGHSDARGDERYNMLLSLKRAQSVKEYLIKKGVDPHQIKSVKGMGEAGLINNCGNGVECSDEQHQQNRRVEILILSNSLNKEVSSQQ
jgi:outer membrane protein OmpA-like peptidoglycan-associated protein